MVAAQLARLLVQHHFGRAMRAAEGVAAIAAKQRRGKAAPIQIHHAHAALGVVLLQQRQCLGAKAVVQFLAAHIGQHNLR